MKPLKTTVFIFICLIFFYVIFDSIQHIRAEVFHRNGYLKTARGYSKQAIRDYKQAVTLMPWETHYRLQLAKSYETTGKRYKNEFDKYISLAIKEYNRLIAFDPVNPWFKARLGLIYHELYKKNPNNLTYKDKAYELSKGATNNDPKNPLFTLHFGHLLYSYGKLDEAKQYYIKTINYDTDLIEAHFNLGSIYKKQNNFTAALPHYQIIHNHLIKMENNYKKSPSSKAKARINSFQVARIFLIQHHFSNNKNKDAYNLIQKMPVSIEKYELLALYFEKVNQKPMAISIYKQLNEKLKTKVYLKKINQLSQ